MAIEIIGLCGPKGVGKSTYAKTLPEAMVFSFAKPLKEMLISILPHEGWINQKEEVPPGFPEHCTVRFPNEAWAIRRWGVSNEIHTKIIHISRDGFEPDENDRHVSEAGLAREMIDKWVTVENGEAEIPQHR